MWFFGCFPVLFFVLFVQVSAFFGLFFFFLRVFVLCVSVYRAVFCQQRSDLGLLFLTALLVPVSFWRDAEHMSLLNGPSADARSWTDRLPD